MPYDVSISFELIFLLHSDSSLIKIHCCYTLCLRPCFVTVSDQADYSFFVYEVSSPIIIAWFMSTVSVIPKWASIPALFRPTAFKLLTSGKDGAIIGTNAKAQIRLR